MNGEISRILEQLDADARHRVHRFDPGSDFARRIAILPSAFNPPTRAHQRLLEVAREVEGIGGSAALLSTRNVDKGVFGAGLPDRVGMLLALHRRRPDLAVLASNAARIMDQAATLRGQHPGIGFDFVVGFDTLVRVFDPHYYEDMAGELGPFFREHRLIATNRAEWTLEDVAAFLERPAVRDFAERIVVQPLEADAAELSSTEERAALGHGKRPKALPPEVEAYVRERRLYLDDGASS